MFLSVHYIICSIEICFPIFFSSHKHTTAEDNGSRSNLSNGRI